MLKKLRELVKPGVLINKDSSTWRHKIAVFLWAEPNSEGGQVF